MVTELNPAIICLQEIFKKNSDELKIKNHEQNNYIHDTGLRTLSVVSILIRKNVPQSKINIDTHLPATAVTTSQHKTVSLLSLYIQPHDPINEKELNNLITQLPKPFVLMGDFNSHDIQGVEPKYGIIFKTYFLLQFLKKHDKSKVS